jgi:hypothetical protein
MEPLPPIWIELIKGGALLVLCVFVWLGLRDFRVEMRIQTKILDSMNRKQARTETLLITLFEQLTGKRVKRANTSPVGHAIRPHSDSDEPPIAMSRTTTDEDLGG